MIVYQTSHSFDDSSFIAICILQILVYLFTLVLIFLMTQERYMSLDELLCKLILGYFIKRKLEIREKERKDFCYQASHKSIFYCCTIKHKKHIIYYRFALLSSYFLFIYFFYLYSLLSFLK